MLDLNSLTWLEAKISGDLPPQMHYSTIFNYSENKKWVYFTRENSSQMEGKFGAYMFDSDNFEFKKIKFKTEVPENKYHSATVYLPSNNQVIVYGGFSFLRNEIHSICNEIDKMQFLDEEKSEKIKGVALYTENPIKDEILNQRKIFNEEKLL
jgi:hypothetical protein